MMFIILRDTQQPPHHEGGMVLACKHNTCVWMPRVTSTTNSIILMICAPPMIVLISDAWPGQSTKVTCSSSYGRCCRWSGIGIAKEENPRSSVMPLSLLCGCLSIAAVESVVDKAATADATRCLGLYEDLFDAPMLVTWLRTTNLSSSCRCRHARVLRH